MYVHVIFFNYVIAIILQGIHQRGDEHLSVKKSQTTSMTARQHHARYFCNGRIKILEEEATSIGMDVQTLRQQAAEIGDLVADAPSGRQ